MFTPAQRMEFSHIDFQNTRGEDEMVTTLDDKKRSAIAMKLADMRETQNLIISNDQLLLSEVDDREIRERLSDMLKDDQKNLSILETSIVQYGVKSEPRDITLKLVEQVKKMMQDSELSLYDKISQHELLKHQQAMTGIIVHKAAQVVGADIDAALAPMNTVNFENRAHQEQLKGILEIVGTRELTGKDPDQGLWARVQDSVAALTGVFGSVVSRSKDMNVIDIVKMDHRKLDTLFAEIENTDSPQKAQEYFGQLYKDLSTHAEAEEQTWYPTLRKYDDSASSVAQAYDEQAEAKVLLEQIKTLSPSSPEFKTRINQLKNLIQEHVRKEESNLLDKLKDHMSDEQLVELGKEFQLAKSRIQDETSMTSSAV